jgi:hypothetical protein
LTAECPEEIAKIMLQCWRVEPNDRPTFAEIYKLISEVVKSQRQAPENLDVSGQVQQIDQQEDFYKWNDNNNSKEEEIEEAESSFYRGSVIDDVNVAEMEKTQELYNSVG